MSPGSGKYPGETNDNPLQYSCLENSMDRGAWWATVHEIVKSWTRLSWVNSLGVARQLQVGPDPSGGSILSSLSPWPGAVWAPSALGQTASVCGFTHPACSELGSGCRCAHLGGQSEDGAALCPFSRGLSPRALVLGPLNWWAVQAVSPPLYLKSRLKSPALFVSHPELGLAVVSSPAWQKFHCIEKLWS